jgi:aryl-alcohol dehydrogenase-like predicted oxidoreductase
MKSLHIAGSDVPRIGLGTNRLEDTDAGAAFVREAIEAGIRLIDTAHAYTGGESEAAIGAALAAGRPDDLVVATKGGLRDPRPETITAEIEESRRRLRVDTIDLYYLHKPSDEVPIEESLEAITRARDAGHIRHIGLSQVDTAQLERARAVADVAAVQHHYNLAHREHDDLVDHCAAAGIPFVPYFPLRDDHAALGEIAERHGVTPAQVTLAWLVRRSPTILPIPGTLSVAHARELGRPRHRADRRGVRGSQLSYADGVSVSARCSNSRSTSSAAVR